VRAGPATAPARRALLARRNPVAKLAAALVLTLALFSTLDPVAPAVVLAAGLACVPLAGLRLRPVLRQGAPVLLGIVGVVLAQMVFAAERTGALLVAVGPLRVTESVALASLGLALRLVAVGLAGVLVVGSTDPTDLADALVQNARVPARFAYGALAALRLVPLLIDEWRSLTLARRARGIDAGRSPAARLRLFAGTAFALLVGAVRRGTRLATAMDARGFDAGVPRSHARPQRFGAADAGLVLAAAAVAAAALGAAVAAGVFRPVLG
jgi:energy-coupling factor transport system permease protein